MTEAKQPEALRLADQLRALSFGGTCILAAAELRRQHARIADLEAQLSAIGAGDGTLHGAIDHWQRRALDAERVLLSRGLVLEEAAKACEERERRANREDVRATCRLCAKDIRSLAVVNQSLTTGPTAHPAAPVAQVDAEVLSMSQALFAQREADALDAARWRFARDSEEDFAICYWDETMGDGGEWMCNGSKGDALDVLDTAMAQAKKGQSHD